MDMSDPSGSAPLDSMSLASPSTSATASMSFPLDILHSQRAVQPTSGFNNPESEVLLWHSSTRQLQPCASTPLPATRTDPFNTLPLELSPKSQVMLDHFTNNRILLHKTVPSTRDPELFRFAISDTALMHGVLVLAASSWMKCCEDMRAVMEPTFFQHKTEAIRIVNQRLGDRSLATSDGTVGAIACLVILEAVNGAPHIGIVHINGLKRLMDLRGDLHTSTINTYLQRIIMLGDLLTSSAIQSKPIFRESPPPEGNQRKVPISSATGVEAHVRYIEQELGLDHEVSNMFGTLHRVSFLVEQNDSGALELEKADIHRSIYEVERSVDTLMRAGQYEARTVKGVPSNSACCIIAANIYVYRYLRRIPSTSTLYDYMVGLLRQDMESVASTVRRVFPREVLFWVYFVGTSASKGRPEEAYFQRELVVSRQVLMVKTWEVAKFVLKKFAWVEGWNEAVDEELFRAALV
ncbi:hypothetical protein L207DRAFT_299209 [Hyaloscypha variabilis F]|uniref:Uncharacterized protein n=1 Tax=Hyaloscypha variabilis (strain UAMH 11265 / GT02V1 / F) TaxID=1149755 RepID=A0A2J6RYB4_HYAVF|nr:hypothetical protein L207DRAFT_299209 [Hyaloscypha variabilis F]